MVTSNVDTTSRIFYWGCCKALPRFPSLNEYVYPYSFDDHAFIPKAVWPTNLVYCTLFNTLHSQEYAGIGSWKGMSRQKFFGLAFIGATLWYFLPGYLFTALSTFTWVCWIKPDNRMFILLFLS